MADARLVLNDALCFCVNKFGRITLKSLKSALSDFYDVSVLSDAKIQLMKDVDSLNLSAKRQHIPQRRDGDARLTREVDDIVALFTFLDEQKALDMLPMYVSSSPDNMPSTRLYEGDLSVIMAMLKSFDGKFSQFESALAAICRDVRDLQVGKVSKVQPQSSIPHTSVRDTNKSPVHASRQPAATSTHGISSRETETTLMSSAVEVDQLVGATTDWATAASTPYSTSNRFAVLSTDDGDLNDDNGESFSTVVRRRRNVKRPRQVTPQQAASGQPASAPQRRPALIGKASMITIGSNIVAAKKFCKKSVYCIDNLSESCSDNDLKAFVSNLSVEVISCFETKPRRRRNESPAKDRKAYRLCINDSDRAKLLNPDVWPESVIVSDWFFRPPGRDEVDKRRRVGDLSRRGDDDGGAVNSDVEPGAADDCLMTTSDDTILAAYGNNTAHEPTVHDGDSE